MTEGGALAGVRVVDLSRVLAGPLCTQTLGDLGADVVKVERPGPGDDTRNWGPPYAGPLSAYFTGVNRNKRSITLDLSEPEGISVLDRMIRGADVLINNFKLGTLERWGFNDEWFETNAPGVIRCSITGYSSKGPKADQPGYDFILQAETGLMAITGEAEGVPMKLGVAIVDICTGMQATIAILAALEARRRTGLGQRCEVNLHDTGLHMLANVGANHLVSGEESGRYGNGHPNIVPYRTYKASDGDMAIAVGNDRQFVVFAGLLGHPEWAEDPAMSTNPQRVRNRDLVDRVVGEVIVSNTRAEWVRTLDQGGIPSGPINKVSEALASAEVEAGEMVIELDHPDAGPFKTLGLPIDFSETPSTVRINPPLLGSDTDDVLSEMGYSVDEIEGLRTAQIV